MGSRRTPRRQRRRSSIYVLIIPFHTRRAPDLVGNHRSVTLFAKRKGDLVLARRTFDALHAAIGQRLFVSSTQKIRFQLGIDAIIIVALVHPTRTHNEKRFLVCTRRARRTLRLWRQARATTRLAQTSIARITVCKNRWVGLLAAMGRQCTQIAPCVVVVQSKHGFVECVMMVSACQRLDPLLDPANARFPRRSPHLPLQRRAHPDRERCAQRSAELIRSTVLDQNRGQTRRLSCPSVSARSTSTVRFVSAMSATTMMFFSASYECFV